MIILNYPSKKALKECIGKQLDYTETSVFGNEVSLMGTTTYTGCNRPSINPNAVKGWREFFAEVTISNGVIINVR